MQNLNQIILCSTLEHRSFLREIQIVQGTAIVTHVEMLPFRYHEILADTPIKGDLVNALERPPIVPERHRGCPLCGNRSTFQCSNCGVMSCKIVGLDRHTCPGCSQEFQTTSVKTAFASESGFVEDRLKQGASDIDAHANRHATWRSSQAGLFEFLKNGAKR